MPQQQIAIQERVPLRNFNTWRVGGPARWLVEVSDALDLRAALQFAMKQRCPILPLGRGSNVLFDDAGYDGLVLVLRNDQIAVDGALWEVGAGVGLPALSSQTVKAGFGGLEFGAGIPGSLGGAIFMNAGASGQEMRGVLSAVQMMLFDGELVWYDCADLPFAYRRSPFQEIPGVIVSAKLSLKPDPNARVQQREQLLRRVASQPYDQPSAGCVFKNPGSGSAGSLIDQAGLKGLRVGDAMVSPKHANFLVNCGHATAADLLRLISTVQQQVAAQCHEQLQLEVRVIRSTDGWCPW
ncbi:MAG: UDP-N-acetylmuramate dehydrogenase [Chlamydiia bacterium]